MRGRQWSTRCPERERCGKKGERRRGACVVGFGKPRRNDAGLRVKIRRLSWLVAKTVVSVYLNMPRLLPHTIAGPLDPRRPANTPRRTFILFLNVRSPRVAKRTLRKSALFRSFRASTSQVRRYALIFFLRVTFGGLLVVYRLNLYRKRLTRCDLSR